ncbi:procyclic acidic repetitive family protein [Streptomyces sp. NBC_00647]
MFNMFEELFAPGRKHTNDERKRLELSRVDVNDGDPGRGPIDLASGKVVVRVPGQEHRPAHQPEPEPDSHLDPEPEPDSGVDPDPEPQPDPELEPNPRVDPEPET